jgi:hypothetical protein
VNNPLVASTPPINQLLGLNKNQLAVGFYNDVNNNPQGYLYDVKAQTFSPVVVKGAVSDAATGINNNNLMCGFYTPATPARTFAFLQPVSGGNTISFFVPGADVTQFLGVNDKGEAVGFYMTHGKTHGLLYNPANSKWQTIDAPNGKGATTLNGINDKHQVVGFYTDPKTGFTHGLLINGVQ